MTRKYWVRSRDPETSWDAGGIDEEKVSLVSNAILALLSEKPRTDEELFKAYTTRGYPLVTPQRIRSARSQLVRMQKVRSTDTYRPTVLGYKSTVWEAINN